MTDTRRSKERVIGSFRCFTDKVLGLGTSGIVYEGQYDGKRVAIKRINQEHVRNEKALLGLELNHENIVSYLNSEENDDFLFIAMDFCRGTLEHLIKGSYKGPSPGTMNQVLHRVALGLEYLHENNVAHRDLKPQNILISADEPLPKVKLADFGIDKVNFSDNYYRTESDTAGTIGWSAPEFYDNRDECDDFSMDVFSLGCVFCYALTGGQHPFGETTLRVGNIRRNEPDTKALHQVKEKSLQLLVLKMIEHDPKQRPELVDILRAILTADLTKGRPTEILGLKWEWLGNRKRDVNEFKFVSSLYAIQDQSQLSETYVLNVGPSSVTTLIAESHSHVRIRNDLFNIRCILPIMTLDGNERPLYVAADHVNHLHVYRVTGNRIQRIVSDLNIGCNQHIDTMLLSPGDGSTIERSPVRILIFCRNYHAFVAELAQNPFAPDNSPNRFTLKLLAKSKTTSVMSVAWCGSALIILSYATSATVYSLGPAAASDAPLQAELVPKFTIHTSDGYTACGSPCCLNGTWLLATYGLYGELTVWDVPETLVTAPREDPPFGLNTSFANNKTLHEPSQKVKCLQWLPASNSSNQGLYIPLIASAYESGLICIWNVQTAEKVQRFNAGSGVQRLTSMSYASSGNLMAVTFENFTVEIWRVPIKDESGLADGEPIKIDEIKGSAKVDGITWHPSGRAFAAVFSDGKVTFRHTKDFS